MLGKYLPWPIFGLILTVLISNMRMVFFREMQGRSGFSVDLWGKRRFRVCRVGYFGGVIQMGAVESRSYDDICLLVIEFGRRIGPSCIFLLDSLVVPILRMVRDCRDIGSQTT